MEVGMIEIAEIPSTEHIKRAIEKLNSNKRNFVLLKDLDKLTTEIWTKKDEGKEILIAIQIGRKNIICHYIQLKEDKVEIEKEEKDIYLICFIIRKISILNFQKMITKNGILLENKNQSQAYFLKNKS